MNQRTSVFVAMSALLTLIFNITIACAAQQEQMARIAVKPAAPQQPEVEHRLVVKFNDQIKARANAGTLLTRVNGANLLGADMAEDHDVQFEQLIQLTENKMTQFEKLACDQSGRPQPDLASMMVVNAPQEKLQQIANSLHESEFVDWVEFEILNPLPPVLLTDTDIAPTTPDYVNQQGYRGANPGLNMDAFWELGNARGMGIKLADCEYWYNGDHEDLCGVISEPGQTPNPGVFTRDFDEHGTACLGILFGRDNGYGITGLSPDVDAFFFPEWTNQRGFNRTSAILNAVVAMDPGDIVLLEMQTQAFGPDFGPAELCQSVWTVVRMASDTGVIVVAAAGNGDQNLDSRIYSFYRARGDSGSIIVGAGTPDTTHSKLSFSTHGSRVDVQGWGRSVLSLGYGVFSQLGGDENQRYTMFNGTSSASAMIAGVCASLQSYAVARVGRRLTPEEMRDVLRQTGWPQGSGANIGRFPNMIEAAQYITSNFLQIGDVNQDSNVDFLDIVPFIALLSTGSFQLEADINQDGILNFIDIAPFINLLAGQ